MPDDVLETFNAALQIKDVEKRRRFLERCDPKARKRVQELLVSYDEAGEFLDSNLFGKLQRSNGCPGKKFSSGYSFGNYRLQDNIGEGSFGIVFAAQQTAPIERKVAIKFLRSESLSESSRQQFAFERDTLSRLNHPGIAKIFDAGVVEEHPFICLEWIDGLPIQEYCRRNQLSVNDRISLVLQVADALRHAHRRGILHLDIKPSNILVQTLDGRPRAILIDFGISKLLDEVFGDTDVRSDRPHLATPAYAPSEMFQSDQAISESSDIYSLSAVLFELLTGKPPYFAEEDRVDRTAGIKVSEFIGQDARMLTGIPMPTARLKKQLANLDPFFCQALTESPSQRHAGIEEFCLPLRNYLDQQAPISPRQVLHRSARWLRENQLAVSAILALLALVAFFGYSGLKTQRIAKAPPAESPLLNRVQLQKESTTPRELDKPTLRELKIDFQRDTSKFADFVGPAIERLSEFGADRKRDEFKSVYWTLFNLAQYQNAIVFAEQFHDSCRAPEDAEAMMISRVAKGRAMAHTVTGFQQGRKIIGSAIEESSDQPWNNDIYSFGTTSVAASYRFRGDVEKATEIFEDLYDHETSTRGPNADESIDAAANLAVMLVELRDTENAYLLLKPVAEQYLENDTRTRLAYRVLQNLGIIYQTPHSKHHDYLKAVIVFEQAAKVAEAIYKDDPNCPDVIKALSNLAITRSKTEKKSDAIIELANVLGREVAARGESTPVALEIESKLIQLRHINGETTPEQLVKSIDAFHAKCRSNQPSKIAMNVSAFSCLLAMDHEEAAADFFVDRIAVDVMAYESLGYVPVSSVNHIGRKKLGAGLFERRLKFCRRLKAKIQGQANMKTACCMLNAKIGELCNSLDQQKEASVAFRKAICSDYLFAMQAYAYPFLNEEAVRNENGAEIDEFSRRYAELFRANRLVQNMGRPEMERISKLLVENGYTEASENLLQALKTSKFKLTSR